MSQTRPCPICHTEIDSNSVICIHCGTNLNTGEALKTDIGSLGHKTIRLVSAGIKMVFIGMIVTMIAPVLSQMVQSDQFPQGLQSYVLIAVVAGPINMLVGPFLCLAVPKETGTRPFIFTAVALLCIAITLEISALLSTPRSDMLSLFGSFASLASAVVFAAFLQQLALFLNETGLADDAASVIGAGILLLCARAALLIPILGCMVLLFYLIGMIYFVFRYAKLLWGMQSVVRHWREAEL